MGLIDYFPWWLDLKFQEVGTKGRGQMPHTWDCSCCSLVGGLLRTGGERCDLKSSTCFSSPLWSVQSVKIWLPVPCYPTPIMWCQPKHHPWQGAQMPHHCLGFTVGGWQNWNDALTCHYFLKPVLYGHMFFWLWQGNLLLLIFRVFVVVVYRWNLLRGSIFGWSEKCHQEQTEMMQKVTVRKLLPKLISAKNSQNPR